MDFKQLEAFVHVVRSGSFSKAAQQLFLTQPTVSTHIKALEHELDTQLIIRSSKDAVPSELGKLLYERAVAMLALRDDAIAVCRNGEHVYSGTISIAASTVPYQHVLPAAMAAFSREHPDVRFDLMGGDSAGVVAEILRGRADIGLCGTQREHPMLTYEALMEDELVIVTPPTEPYLSLRRKESDIGAFAGFPFILREKGSGTRRETEVGLIRRGIRPEALHVVAQMNNPDAIFSAVEQGLGISMVSRLSCREHERMERLLVFQLAQEPVLRNISLVFHHKRPMSPVATIFRRFLLARYREI